MREIGSGTYPAVPDEGEFQIKLPADLTAQSKNLKNFIDEIYPDLEGEFDHAKQSDNYDFFQGRCILTPKNVTVDQINDRLLKKLPGQEHVLSSRDWAAEVNNNAFLPPDFWHP